MNDKSRFVDTNVLIYAIDVVDNFKKQIAIELVFINPFI